MSWEVLFLINLIFAALREFTYKKISNRINPFFVLFAINILAGIWLTIYYIIIYKGLPPILPIVGLGGIFYIFGFISYLKAISFSLSQSMLFSSFAVIITILLSAVFLGESEYFDLSTATGIKFVAGIILAFISLWLLLHSGSKKEARLEIKWFWYIAITIISYGTGSFFSVYFMKQTNPIEVVISQIYLEIPVSLLLLFLLNIKVKIESKKMGLLVTNSIFSTISMMSFYYILLYLPASKLYPLQQVALVIITALLGAVFFGESKNLAGKKLVGMAMGFMGMVLLITA